MKHEPVLQIAADIMIPPYVYCKPFLDNCRWQNRFKPGIQEGLVWYTDRSKTNQDTGTGVYRWGSKMGHSLILWLHTTVFQAEIYAINARVMENMEKLHGWEKSVFLLIFKQPLRALKFSDKLYLVWVWHHSLLKLAKHNGIQLLCVPGHVGTHGNEIADQLSQCCFFIQ